ncbi:MAG: Xaa-Pro peptidase family protein [Pirellulales bacterium]|nr:Xaa-Pro peptidase family protein [Pirellulales bacterium]
MDRPSARRSKLRRLLKRDRLPGLLVTNFTNVQYLTGFAGGDTFLLITGDDEILISDTRYETDLSNLCPDMKAEIRGPSKTTIQAAAEIAAKRKLPSLGFESGSLTVSMHGTLDRTLPKTELVATEGLVEELREIKDADEIAAIRRAVEIAEKVFNRFKAGYRGDWTERGVAADLEHEIRQRGGLGCAFEPIIGVGDHGALPHAMLTDRRFDEASTILVDWGAREAGGYRSDLTRILNVGKIPAKLEKAYNAVLKAQITSIERIKPGVRFEQIDTAARKVIEKAGMGKNFTHAVGHGIGLGLHEAPRLGPGQTGTLQAGMVVTVEPGVYFPGKFGIRIEDDVLVTKNGFEILTSVPKELSDTIVS